MGSSDSDPVPPLLDLGDLTREALLPFVGRPFRLVREAGDDLELALASVEALGDRTAPPTARRRPFSLVFHGPPAPVLPQAIYRLTEPELGDLELFLVPIGPHEGAMRYEAIFT